MKTARVFIKGDVIGVGFRAWTAIQAKKLGVKGWVHNVYDRPEVFGPEGGVEALLQADEVVLNDIVALLKKGPPVSEVLDLTVSYIDSAERFDSFEVRG